MTREVTSQVVIDMPRGEAWEKLRISPWHTTMSRAS
jgi:hypothetical protein